MDTNSKHHSLAAIIVLLVTSLACSLSSNSTPSINTAIVPSSSQIPGISTSSIPLGKIFFSAVSISTSITPSSSSSSRVYSMNPDGSELTQLTLDDGIVLLFEVSPTGNKIAIITFSPSTWLLSMSILDKTGERVTLPINLSVESNIVWSPTGDQLVFDYGDIYKINSDGTELVNLTNSPGSIDSDPEWSPDGKRIVYVSNYDVNVTRLCIMDSNGNNSQILTNFPKTVYYGNVDLLVSSKSPNWAPDGQHIVFISNFSGEAQIYIIDALNPNTNPLISLTEQNYYHLDYLRQPSWSPDGKYILFSASDGIYVVSVDGNTLTKVTEGANITPPLHWSPDGQWIGFLSNTVSSTIGLFIIRPNGNDLRLIKVFPDKDILQFSWK